MGENFWAGFSIALGAIAAIFTVSFFVRVGEIVTAVILA